MNNKNFTEADLEILFKNNFNPLCAYCRYRFGFELDEAKEAVHTAFIRLWENRANISAELSVKAYIYKIVSNISLDMLKHEKVRQKHGRQVSRESSDTASFRTLNDMELKQLVADIDSAMNELPEQMRRIFEMSRYEGLKYSEISAQLQISVKTVETQMSRALVKMRQKLAPYLTILSAAILINM